VVLYKVERKVLVIPSCKKGKVPAKVQPLARWGVVLSAGLCHCSEQQLIAYSLERGLRQRKLC
jgi:hypothetical protein